MNLYKVSRTDTVGYDEYDSAIIAALNEGSARLTDPSSYLGWCSPYESLEVELIGEAIAGTQQGVILASFNAG